MPSSSPDQPQAVIYAAKSTPDEHDSIPAQLEECRGDAEAEGFPVDGEYSDEAVCGWSDDRGPGLAAAMEHVERIKGVLIVQHSDRLARGDGVQARHLVEIALWAIKAGVTIRSILDPQTFENLLMAVIMGERNTEDSRRKSEAVKADSSVGTTVGGGHPYKVPILLIARTIPVRGAGETRFTLRPTEKARALLEERASLKAKVKVAYTPKGRPFPEYRTADVTLEG